MLGSNRIKYLLILLLVIHLCACAENQYEKTVRLYYSSLANKELEIAYALLSEYSVSFRNPDGSGGSFRARPDFDSWKQSLTNTDSIALIRVYELKTHPRPDDFEAMLGFKLYEVEYYETVKKIITHESGKKHMFVWLVRGQHDGKVRILGIGTGP